MWVITWVVSEFTVLKFYKIIILITKIQSLLIDLNNTCLYAKFMQDIFYNLKLENTIQF